MKKIVLSVPFLMWVVCLQAQKTKTVPKTTVKSTSKPVPVLKTTADSLSYILGEVTAFGLIQKGLGDVKITNQTAFMHAINDIQGKKKTLIEDAAANSLLNDFMMKLQAEKSKTEIAKGEKFLAENKKKPGVRTTASGLQYEVLQEGTGIRPTAVDTFVCNYRGTLIDGTEFDASANRGEPLIMAVSQVIPGWIEGLQLMQVGAKYKFYIPYNLGYGLMGSGAKIPGGAALIFDLELLDVKKLAQ
jgi:FKBP-type peptidyl-prolyl cis-trans isomerase FklB